MSCPKSIFKIDHKQNESYPKVKLKKLFCIFQTAKTFSSALQAVVSYQKLFAMYDLHTRLRPAHLRLETISKKLGGGAVGVPAYLP